MFKRAVILVFSLWAGLGFARSDYDYTSQESREQMAPPAFESHPPYLGDKAVRSFGRLTSIKDNTLTPFFSLSQVRNKKLYGIGMARHLNRELLVVGGELYTSGMDKNVHVSKKQNPHYDPEVSFFVFAEVPAWRRVTLTKQEDIRTFADLESAILNYSKTPQSKLNSNAPFPVRIRARVAGLKWFIVGGMGNGQPNWQTSFFRQRLLGGLEDVKIEAFGFYVPGGNMIWTSKDSNMHIHFRTLGAKNELFVGHIDEQLQIAGDLEVEIPE